MGIKKMIEYIESLISVTGLEGDICSGWLAGYQMEILFATLTKE